MNTTRYSGRYAPDRASEWPGETAGERLGAVGALLAGGLFLLLVVYVYGVLARLGLSAEMFDDRLRLFPWVAAHRGAYTALWWLTLLSTVALLPAPLAVHDRLRHAAPGVSRFAAVAGVGGVVLGLLSPLVMAAVSPVLAQAYVSAEPATQAAVLATAEAFAQVGLHLRMGANLLLAIWLGTAGALMLRSGLFGARLGGACLVVAVFTLLTVATKPFALADLEPFVAPLLGLVYLWLGVALWPARPAQPSAA